MRILSIAVALVLPQLASAGVVINEVLPNVTGVDSGYEWVEITNNGPVAENLDGWFIERSTSGAFTQKFSFPNHVLNPGEHVLVGGEFVVGADYNLASGTFFSFGNASSSGDAVRICDQFAAIIDTVVYGPNNNDGFTDDNGAVANPAPAPMEDESIAREPDGVDTDESDLDFVVDVTPTPGLDNASLPLLPPMITMAMPGTADQNNMWDLFDAPASCNVVWIWGTTAGAEAMPGGNCPGVDMGIVGPNKLGSSATDAFGESTLTTFIPAGAAGNDMLVQAVVPCTCQVSNVSTTTFF